MDDKLTAKTAKFTSLENLYLYGISVYMHCLNYSVIIINQSIHINLSASAQNITKQLCDT